MAVESAPGHHGSARRAALASLARSAALDIPGTDFVSITVRSAKGQLSTFAATDPTAERADGLQYELREGPCYATVTHDRFVMVNDMAAALQYPRYAPRAVELGIGAQTSIQLLDEGERAGLNLYARAAGSFDRSTVHLAGLFAAQAAAVLGYAQQVEQLSEALRTRTDIGTAVGILMERYGIDQPQAFAFLTRSSQQRNVKVRLLARQVVDGTFESSETEDRTCRERP